MSDQLSPLDLKFLPDWLKETPSANKYANFQGESEGRFDRDRSSRGPSRGGADRGRGGNERRGDRPDRGLRQPPRSAPILLPRNSRLSFFRKKARPRASQTRSAKVPARIRSLARRDCFWKNLRDTSSESPAATHRNHFSNSTMARLALKES